MARKTPNRKKSPDVFGVVYQITNVLTLKRYVGYTVLPLRVRWKLHWKDAMAGRGWTLHAAIRKYGKHNFTVEAITPLLPQTVLPQIEIFHIYLSESHVSEFGYNVTRGGDGVPCTDEMRKKMSAAQSKRLPPSAETRQKISKAHKGKIMTPEQREKLSKAKTGKPLSPAHAEAKRLGQIGTKRSPETKAKMSASATGDKHHMWGKSESEETKAKKSASLRKHFAANPREEFSEETRAKMSEAKKNDPNMMARMRALADRKIGKPPSNKGGKHSEETKAKMKAAWVILNQKRAEAKEAVEQTKLMVKAQLLTLATEEIYTHEETFI